MYFFVIHVPLLQNEYKYHLCCIYEYITVLHPLWEPQSIEILGHISSIAVYMHNPSQNSLKWLCGTNECHIWRNLLVMVVHGPLKGIFLEQELLTLPELTLFFWFSVHVAHLSFLCSVFVNGMSFIFILVLS